MAAESGTKSLATGVNLEMTCPVCLELFKTPKTLPCLHTFCEECLTKSIPSSSAGCRHMNCPTCRGQHNLPPKGVEGFSTNFTATNLIELLSLHKDGPAPVATVLKCENEIDDNPAATKCLDCNFYLCEDCTADHKKHRVSRHHKLATLAELKEGGAKQLEQKRYCSAHEGEELKLYCRTCQEVICRDCAIVTHKQHDYTFIKDVREELTKEMETLLASVDGKEAEYQGLLDSVQHATEKEKQKLATEEASVKMFFDSRITALQDCKIYLLTNLAQASAVHTKQLLADEELIQFSCTRLTSARIFTQQLFSSASSTDLAMMSKQVIQQLESIRQHKLKTIDASMWGVSLSEDDPLSSKFLSVSAIITDSTVLSDVVNPALVGKNTFKLSVINIPENVVLEPAVTVTLSSGDSCPVKITPSGNNSWSVMYIITCYPIEGNERHVTKSKKKQKVRAQQPMGSHSYSGVSSPAAAVPTVKVTVKINGVQPKNGLLTLPLKKEMAVGTRVEQGRRQGTVITYEQDVCQHLSMNLPDGYALVQLDSSSNSQQLSIDQLKVLTE